MNHILFLDNYQQLRNFVLIVAVVVLACSITLLWKLAGYRKTYFLLSFLYIVFPAFIIFFGQWFDVLGDLAQAIIISFTLLLPPIVLVLSVRNLNKQLDIPRWLSIVGIILSSVLIVIFFMAIMTGGGGGMIG